MRRLDQGLNVTGDTTPVLRAADISPSSTGVLQENTGGSAVLAVVGSAYPPETCYNSWSLSLVLAVLVLAILVLNVLVLNILRVFWLVGSPVSEFP